MEHLSTEGLAAFIDGSLDEAERAAAVAHLADCADCRREMMEIRRALPARRIGPSVAAATAVALAASIVVLLVPSSDAPGPLRGVGEEALAAYGAEGDLADSRPDLAWASAGPGAVYRVAVTSSAGAAIWRTSTEDTVAAFPDSITLGRGTTYRWWVEALMPDGGTRATSVREFRIPP